MYMYGVCEHLLYGRDGIHVMVRVNDLTSKKRRALDAHQQDQLPEDLVQGILKLRHGPIPLARENSVMPIRCAPGSVSCFFSHFPLPTSPSLSPFTTLRKATGIY